MSNFGIKTSKPGKDAAKVGIRDLLLDSSYPLLKIKASGSGSLSVADGSPDSDTINHNLGYIPNVMVFGEIYLIGEGKSSQYRRFPEKDFVSTYYSDFTYAVDSSKLVISGNFWDGSSSSDTFNYFYYIFYDE